MRLDTSNKPREWTGQLQYNALSLTILVGHLGATLEAAELPALLIAHFTHCFIILAESLHPITPRLLLAYKTMQQLAG
jgi:hypothetical protein